MAESAQLSFQFLPDILPARPEPTARGRAAATSPVDLPQPPPLPPAEFHPGIAITAGGIRGRIVDPALTSRCRNICRRLDLPKLALAVEVCWNRRLVTTAGLAHHADHRIDLNPRLAEFQPDEPGRTIKHELAHLIAQHRAGRRRIQPHGAQWRLACAELGIPGEQRCHELPFARRSVRRKFAYRCRHCGIIVPRVKKLVRDSACYPCCRTHNRGRYSVQYPLDPVPLAEARALMPDIRWA